jgi:hypothetical protein
VREKLLWQPSSTILKPSVKGLTVVEQEAREPSVMVRAITRPVDEILPKAAARVGVDDSTGCELKYFYKKYFENMLKLIRIIFQYFLKENLKYLYNFF